MNRQNKKENVAELHKKTIMQAAEKIFLEKGFAAATIDDISKVSQYSRRTLYTYFDSKEDILYNIILNGLISLKEDLIRAISENSDFIEQYKAVCLAMKKYHESSPQSFDSINRARHKEADFDPMPEAITQIFILGTEINNLLKDYIESGIKKKIVRSDIKPMQSVYVMWAGISSLLSMVQTKGDYLEKEFSATKDDFLEYGFKQIINSVLEERI